MKKAVITFFILSNFAFSANVNKNFMININSKYFNANSNYITITSDKEKETYYGLKSKYHEKELNLGPLIGFNKGNLSIEMSTGLKIGLDVKDDLLLPKEKYIPITKTIEVNPVSPGNTNIVNEDPIKKEVENFLKEQSVSSILNVIEEYDFKKVPIAQIAPSKNAANVALDFGKSIELNQGIIKTYETYKSNSKDPNKFKILLRSELEKKINPSKLKNLINWYNIKNFNSLFGDQLKGKINNITPLYIDANLNYKLKDIETNIYTNLSYERINLSFYGYGRKQKPLFNSHANFENIKFELEPSLKYTKYDNLDLILSAKIVNIRSKQDFNVDFIEPNHFLSKSKLFYIKEINLGLAKDDHIKGYTNQTLITPKLHIGYIHKKNNFTLNPFVDLKSNIYYFNQKYDALLFSKGSLKYTKKIDKNIKYTDFTISPNVKLAYDINKNININSILGLNFEFKPKDIREINYNLGLGLDINF